MLPTTLALLILAALMMWWAGGLLLRTSGALLAMAGLVIAVLGSAAGLLLFLIGAAFWIAGQAHHAVRHHAYSSPLARRVFTQLLPMRLDPARGWAIRTTPATRTPVVTPASAQARRAKANTNRLTVAPDQRARGGPEPRQAAGSST